MQKTMDPAGDIRPDSDDTWYVPRKTAAPPGVIDPQHYTATKIEPIDVIEAWGLGFCLANAVKYIARADRKGSRNEDLLKAANYLYRAATGKWLPKEVVGGK